MKEYVFETCGFRINNLFKISLKSLLIDFESNFWRFTVVATFLGRRC